LISETKVFTKLFYMFRNTGLLISLVFITVTVTGQQSFEAGLFGGGSYYLGDLNPVKHFVQTDFAYGAMLRYNHTDRWAVKASVYRGKIKADDEVTKANTLRQLSFESNLTDISTVVEFNFFEYVTGSTRDRITPYIFAGISFFMFNPQADGINLREAGTEGQNVGYDGRKPYETFGFAFPFGFGFKYSLNERLGLSFEWGLRKTFTDYLDDVSKTYYLSGESIDRSNPSEVLSDPTFNHQPGMERGDPQTKDWYNFTGISITYKFNLFRNYRCNDFGTRRKY